MSHVAVVVTGLCRSATMHNDSAQVVASVACKSTTIVISGERSTILLKAHVPVTRVRELYQ